MKIEWINLNNERVLFADFSKLLPNRMVELQNELFTEVEKAKGRIKILSNFADTNISPKFIEVSTHWAKKMKVKTDRYAVYGLNAPKRIMLNAFNGVTNMGIKAFETREDAIAFLTR